MTKYYTIYRDQIIKGNKRYVQVRKVDPDMRGFIHALKVMGFLYTSLKEAEAKCKLMAVEQRAEILNTIL